jgi:hypothetical protein
VDEAQLAATRHTGIAAEIYVSELLQFQYGDSFNAAQNWVSGARAQVLPHTVEDQPADDTLGYDFELLDSREWLVKAQAGAPKVQCYIEVKVCASTGASVAAPCAG